MATKKKAKKKKPSKTKKVVKKVTAAKKTAKRSPKKAAAKKKSGGTKTALKRTAPPAKPVRSTRTTDDVRAYPSLRRGTVPGQDAGDLQGLSVAEGADSESVEELVDEGNAFEAGVVEGVEEAGDDEREVHTHEVPEDDVPEEYLDKDE
jgi:hypothetical protein